MDRVELLAEEDERFNYLLGGVWQGFMNRRTLADRATNKTECVVVAGARVLLCPRQHRLLNPFLSSRLASWIMKLSSYLYAK